ncbi:unnamed protein product [Adineta steineri]|uniref:Uncharacterized protein n=1 Tax=Adineta steineri TaxID=433720 RepID=A0A814P793_9BILA|nr:unnamed protein product [Adineta steineri]CAF4202315.1 unnamed protein product [Adineta steineri]
MYNTNKEKKQAPFIKPLNYDPNSFIILQRYINSLIISGQYPSGDKFDICDSFGSAFISDAINLNQNYIHVTNLLVPVCHAASHVAYAATRIEPCFMLLGGASGYAAAYSILNENIDVQAVNIKQIQQILINDRVLLHYPQGHCNE